MAVFSRGRLHLVNNEENNISVLWVEGHLADAEWQVQLLNISSAE